MRRAARTDSTAKTLRAYAESLGFVVVPINGVIDCLLVWGTQTVIVDWKSPGGTLTPDQAKLVARGVPVRFVTTPAQVDHLLSELEMRGTPPRRSGISPYDLSRRIVPRAKL
jgi:hypothetical protein